MHKEAGVCETYFLILSMPDLCCWADWLKFDLFLLVVSVLVACLSLSRLDLERREGDSNPRNAFDVYTLSRRASSATRASLLGLMLRLDIAGKDLAELSVWRVEKWAFLMASSIIRHKNNDFFLIKRSKSEETFIFS